MKRRTLITAGIGLVALLLAITVARLTVRHMQSTIATVDLVVATQQIQPYTVITADMLTTKTFPEEVVAAAIYLHAQDVVGQVARVEILPDVPIYQAYVVPPDQARFTSDAGDVVVSLRMDTARAVGGLVAPGQRVDVWRIAKSQTNGQLDADSLLALHGASVELLALGLRVLAVQGQAGSSGVQEVMGTGWSAQSNQRPEQRGVLHPEQRGVLQQPGRNISIVTLEVSQELAPALVRLMGEAGGRYDLWLTLSPLVRDRTALALAPVYTPEPALDPTAVLAALTPSPTPTATPTGTSTSTPAPTFTPTATSTPNLIAEVKPGPQRGVNVRSGPGLAYPVVAMAVAGDELRPVGRDESQQWLQVCCVDANRDGVGDDEGWVLADLVDLHGTDITTLPLRIVSPPPTPTPRSRAAATGMDYQAQAAYRNEPGDKKLNYVRVRALSADGTGIGGSFSLSWPGGSVSCPGDIPVKPDGWCEFTATEGEFTVSLAGRAQPVVVTLPYQDQHTVATVVWRRFW